MKYIILGTSQFALRLCEAIKDNGSDVVMIISLIADKLPENSFDFKDFCRFNKIKLFLTQDINNKETEQVIKSLNPDFLVVAWPKILDEKILKIPKFFTIGTHPTKLPFNKGRHPVHWSIVLGLKFNYLSFFRMDTEIDSGRILLQKKYTINKFPISEVMKNLEETAYLGMYKLCKILQNDPSYKGKQNNKKIDNFWRKRNIHDITLDPRMSGKIFINTVKSFSPPYSGSILLTSSVSSFIIDNAKEIEKFKRPTRWENREYGYIFKINEKEITLKVSDTVLLLTYNNVGNQDIKYLKGYKIMPPSFYYEKMQK